MAFEKEIKEYEELRRKYQTLIINKMDREEYVKYNEVLFSTHSCAIEGNSFSVDDTRELKEKGLGMIPAGKTLFEAFEMLDHFEAFEYMMQNTQHPLDENAVHPMILAARFHGFYEYLHPFRDGNGRTGRLISNYILLRLGHPLLIIPSEARQEYISTLRMIRTEATDEHLIRFFFKMAMLRMDEELKQKEANTKRFRTFLF